jgi:hypothetical protein
VIPIRVTTMLLLVAGCDRLPSQLADCDEPACQQRWVAAHIEADTDATVAAVRALPPGVDRDTLIQVMMAEWPRYSTPLCADLGSELVRERCDTLTARPHLWQVDPEDPSAGSAGAGSAYPVLSLEVTLPPHPWDDLEPFPVDCAEDWTANTCTGRRAMERAERGQHQDAWRICKGAEQEKWRYECFFQVSERIYDPRENNNASIAAELCVASGFYMERCLGHLAGKLGRWAPAASSDDPDRWRELDQASMEVHNALQPMHPQLGQRWVALMWAYAMDAAYANITTPVGNPMDSVGASAVPHIAASVAWTLWTSENGRAQSLDAWIDQFQSAMLRREVDPAPEPMLDESAVNGAGWAVELPGEDQIAWTVYRGPVGRRALGMNPRSDAAICILEAAARNPTPHRVSLFREALNHPDSVVRWTAARLAGTRVPEALEGVDPGTESDALVRARLEYGLAQREE